MRWLVISDIHATISNFQTSESKNKIYEMLKRQASICKFNFIIITGDCMNKHNGGQEAIEFIKKIIECCGDNVKIYMCAGNHDILRSDKDISRRNMIETIRNNRTVPNKIFYLDAYEAFQKIYSELVKEETYSPCKIYDEPDY